ncbi:MAG TPA: hypothetical protein ENK57_17585 [Polyangiaceae bacterium]|nr:hypothetical protein [Polyangiaceae bacterium]
MTNPAFHGRKLAWLGVSVLVGCGAARPRDTSGEGHHGAPAADAASASANPDLETTGGASPASDREPAVASLDALVAEALAHHPALERARHEASASWEVPSQVGALPDPVFSVASSCSTARVSSRRR